jgi:hypothetical protein
MYGDAFLAEYAEMMHPDQARLIRTREERGIQWTILRADSPALEVLDTLQRWRRLYTDEIAVVRTRTDES